MIPMTIVPFTVARVTDMNRSFICSFSASRSGTCARTDRSMAGPSISRKNIV